MTETRVSDWTERRGLRGGFPDPGWTTFCKVYPKFGIWEGNRDTPELHWTCKIVYGTTWGHCHFGQALTLQQAVRIAFTKAVKAGMPLIWAPGDLDL